jgi:hypothetical protein
MTDIRGGLPPRFALWVEAQSRIWTPALMRLAFIHCPFRACVPSSEACRTNEMTDVSATRVC